MLFLGMGRFVNRRVVSKDRKNDTEDKKNNNLSGVIGSIDKYLGVFLKMLTILGLLASVFATFSLIYYAHEENVNIFSHHSSWVSILPVIASLELLIGLWLFSIVFVPGIQVFLLNHLCNNKKTAGRKVFVFMQHLFMLTFILVGVKCPDIYNETLFKSILILLIALVFMAFFWSCGHKDYSFPSLFSLFFVGLAIVYISFFSVIVIAYWVVVDDTGWGEAVMLILVFFSIISVFMDGFVEDQESILVFRLTIFLVAIVSLFMTPFSATISREALKSLGMGGVERVYYVNKDDKAKVPIPFIDDTCCDDYEFCLTEKLSIKWAVGDLVYASLSEEIDEQGEAETDQEKINKQVVPKQTIALPRAILFSYNVDKGDLMGCKTQQKLIEAANKESKAKP